MPAGPLPYVVLSLLGGAIIPVQLYITQALRSSSGASQLQATLYLYAGGVSVALLLSLLLNGGVVPPAPHKTAWWMWSAGLLGAFYILFMFLATPVIGAANTLVWVFLGQVILALVLDKLGLPGMAVREITPYRLLGLLLIFAGGLLMLKNGSP